MVPFAAAEIASAPAWIWMTGRSLSTHKDPEVRLNESEEPVLAAVVVVPGPNRTRPTSARWTTASEFTPVTRRSPVCTICEETMSREEPFEARTSTAPAIFVTTGTAVVAAAEAKAGHRARPRQTQAK